MSNIDLSMIVTVQARTELEAAEHAAAVRTICRERILSVLSLSIQQNLVQAACRVLAADVSADPL